MTLTPAETLFDLKRTLGPDEQARLAERLIGRPFGLIDVPFDRCELLALATLLEPDVVSRRLYDDAARTYPHPVHSLSTPPGTSAQRNGDESCPSPNT